MKHRETAFTDLKTTDTGENEITFQDAPSNLASRDIYMVCFYVLRKLGLGSKWTEEMRSIERNVAETSLVGRWAREQFAQGMT